MDAGYYRKQAEEVRAQARRIIDGVERDRLLEIAVMYGQRAETVEDEERCSQRPDLSANSNRDTTEHGTELTLEPMKRYSYAFGGAGTAIADPHGRHVL
jgi:hypothetical protein